MASHKRKQPSETFANKDFPIPLPLPLMGGRGAIPVERVDVCGFIVLPNSHHL